MQARGGTIDESNAHYQDEVMASARHMQNIEIDGFLITPQDVMQWSRPSI
jgi:hypothetical protein